MKETGVKERVSEVIKLLSADYSDAKTELAYQNPLELLIATILSAQSTDTTVNIVTKSLFKKYRTAADYANAGLAELEQDIKSTGFYHNKARNIQNACKMIVERYDSKVPKTMEDLTSLPGVGRKTANIVLGSAYGITEGIAVDTHVTRVSFRLGLTRETDPVKIEKDLMAVVPKEYWPRFSHMLVLLGRRICTARKPKCAECSLSNICPSAFKV